MYQVLQSYSERALSDLPLLQTLAVDDDTIRRDWFIVDKDDL